MIDADQYERRGKPEFAIDVAGGVADSFSLEGPLGVQFVSNGSACRPSS